MLNVKLNVEGDELVARVDLSESHGLSSSGKTVIVASTQGNVSVPGHEDVKLGLNVYKPRK